MMLVVFWFVIVGSSCVWNMTMAQKGTDQILVNVARSFFKEVEITRLWNAKHGGVYVPISKETRPNPYLDSLDRDIVTSAGIKLTRINPAYMTRQISAIAKKQRNIQYHMTSLTPLRPANKADEWETSALYRFESGEKEFSQLIQKSMVFRYMAPLLVQEACLKCHDKQGYELGDIRGAISVSIPAERYLDAAQRSKVGLMMIHGIVLLVGVFLVWFFARYRNRQGREMIQKNIELEGEIADRKLAEAKLAAVNLSLETKVLELRQAEEELNRIFNTAADGMRVIDKNFQVTRVNETMLSLSGLSHAEFVGKKCYEVFPGSSCHTPNCPMTQILEGESRIEVEIEKRHKSGAIVSCILTAKPFYDQAGICIGIVENFKDITARIESEKALQLTSAINAAMAQLGGAFMKQMSLDDISFMLLEQAINLTQSKNGFVGFLDPKSGNFICPTLVNPKWTGPEMKGKSHIFEHANGLLGWVLDNKKPLLTNAPKSDPRATGLPKGHLALNRLLCVPALLGEELVGGIFLANSGNDYSQTELEVIEQLANLYAIAVQKKHFENGLADAKVAAEQANRAKSDFLANMSHEIRTPMNAILGMNRLALESAIDQKQVRHLDIVQSSAEFLLALLNDILDFSKIEAGQIELEERSFHISNVLHTVKNTLAIMAEKKGLQLLFDAPDNLPTALVGDEFRLRQILLNLVSNAVKFTETGGVFIQVKVLTQDDTETLIQFSVKDTGVGLSEEAQKNIFEQFTQADSSITRTFGGTGLGLTICKKLIHLLGGKIWLESVLGEGSTFHFTSRFKNAEAGLEVKKTAISSENILLPSLKILLVEDNLFNQELAQQVIEQEGHTIACAENGVKALEELAINSFDVILMDVQMPVLDGIETTQLIRLCEGEFNIASAKYQELLQQIQNKISGTRIPIIAMTAQAMSGDRASCIEAGMDDYLTKPFQPEEIFAVLGRTVF